MFIWGVCIGQVRLGHSSPGHCSVMWVSLHRPGKVRSVALGQLLCSSLYVYGEYHSRLGLQKEISVQFILSIDITAFLNRINSTNGIGLFVEFISSPNSE